MREESGAADECDCERQCRFCLRRHGEGAAGVRTGNVQGKVLYNNAPVENIRVTLCETFSRFLSGCGGKTYTVKTDKDGDFLIANLEPKEYEGLIVYIFDTAVPEDLR